MGFMALDIEIWVALDLQVFSSSSGQQSLAGGHEEEGHLCGCRSPVDSLNYLYLYNFYTTL